MGDALGYAFIVALCGVPIGVISCLPGMVVAVMMYPAIARSRGHVVAVAGTSCAVGGVSAVILIGLGAGGFAVVMAPLATVVTALGLLVRPRAGSAAAEMVDRWRCPPAP